MGRDVDQHNAVVEQRIAHVVELILDGKWRTGKTVQDLAEQWGLGTARVYNYVAEANQRVRSEIASRTAVTIQRTLTKVARLGRKGAQPGDLSAAVQASVALAKIASWDQPCERAPEQSTDSAPRTITVTYHQSVKPPEEQAE